MFKKQTASPFWYGVALLAVVMAAPNSTIIKATLEDVGPLWFNVLRFSVVALIMTPFVAQVNKKRLRSRALRYAVIAGCWYALAVVGYTTAISLSQASFVSTIDLAIPVLLMVYSALLTKEKITKKSYIGIGVAALGAATIMTLPSLLSGGASMGFGVLPTALALLNCFSFPLAVIFSRKASDEGLSLWATFGIMAYIIVPVNLILAVMLGHGAPAHSDVLSLKTIGAVLYSAIAVSLLARLFTVAAYRRIGAASVAVLTYVESFISILLPIVLLRERPTPEMLLGGSLILIGVLIIEAKQAPQLHRHRKTLPRHT